MHEITGERGRTPIMAELRQNDSLLFEPVFSVDGAIEKTEEIHRLFDETPEQVTHGRALWDRYGWSRDNWIL